MVRSVLPPARKLIVPILAIHLVLAAVSFATLALTKSLPVKSALIVAVLLFLVIAPVSAAVTLLMARLPDPRLPEAVVRTACRRPGYLFGAFTGAILGVHYWGTPGAIAMGLGLLAAGWLLGDRIGAFFWAQLQRQPR